MSGSPDASGSGPAAWQLPQGVNRPLWDYATAERLALDEEEYFRGHPLLETDSRFLLERFRPSGTLIDLGCGTGRLSLLFARTGFSVTAVDLSLPMLRQLGRRGRAEGLDIRPVRANLCDLGSIPDASFGHALSMFSTLGMIRGASNRRRALDEAARVLREGGRLALHAHNLWLNLRDPQGRRWLLGELPRWLLGRADAGDRRMTYRGIPNMQVHLYRWGELRRDLRWSGFEIEEVVPLDAVSAEVIRWPGFLPTWRAEGWILFARKTQSNAVVRAG